MKFKVLEQYTLGGTVYSFPRAKIVMTAPMDLPLYGKIKLYDTSKTELINLWEDASLEVGDKRFSITYCRFNRSNQDAMHRGGEKMIGNSERKRERDRETERERKRVRERKREKK